MTIVKDKRAGIVWALLACTMINAFVCSLNHASHVGFGLAMGQDAFCLGDGVSPVGSVLPIDGHGLSEQALDCPLCGSVFLGILVLFSLAWLGRRVPSTPPRPQRERLGPRYHWPALNPRAP